jgi:hypothetical protein
MIMEKNLWNEIESNSIYSTNKELYQTHILEQYKICVEMSDKISERRNQANVFFLTLNTLSITSIGFLIQKIPLVNPRWAIVFPLIGTLILCLIWLWLVRSYRDLNSAKFKIIGFYEKKLPSSPLWSAEWNELGQGKDISKYLPLTFLEKFVPFVFGTIYLLLGIYFLFLM